MSLGTTRERENLYSFAVGFLKSKNAAEVLDVACDDGTGTIILTEGFSGEIIGLDINPKAIDFAKSSYSVPNLKFVEGDGRRMNFADGTFDVIVSFHTIEHMGGDDQALFVKELRRVLKPGGSLLIATPDGEVWKLQGIAYMQEGHIKELSRKELESVLTRNGFNVAQAYGQRVLKKSGFSAIRKILNFLKKLDVFRLRRLIGKNAIDALDQGTQPVELNDEVVPLGADDKASVNVFVCQRA
ncbi:MAG: class I SAM-dependent methyltransferase [Candidatus Liptonbacteria bacterium]|nr:class I SAM-dependent methyltransferase [Candidatus Liptonbacteria bacterium]